MGGEGGGVLPLLLKPQSLKKRPTLDSACSGTEEGSDPGALCSPRAESAGALGALLAGFSGRRGETNGILLVC